MSNLDDLYREIILDHYRSPRNRGELTSPPAQRVEGFNPLCGDEIVLYLNVEDDVLVDIKLAGQGCSISQASSSMMSSAVKGKSLEQVREAARSRPTCAPWANWRRCRASSSSRYASSVRRWPGTPSARRSTSATD